MSIWDWLFPKRCVSCGGWGAYVCAECVNQVKVIERAICPMCGKGAMWGVAHVRCRRPWGMEGLVAGLQYRGVSGRLVRKLKYRMVTDVTDEIVELWVSLTDWLPLSKDEWVVVPVPLHQRREKWRGFNQAEELGKRLADALGWIYVNNVLVRMRYTKPQMEMDRNHREKNILGAFERGVHVGRVKSRRVVLVDDVWTTGATMRECTKVLKRSGAKEVWGVVVAR